VSTTRRALLAGLASSFGAAVGALGLRPLAGPPSGELLETLPFLDERKVPLGKTVGSGLGRRQAFDLSTLSPESLVTPNEKFFIRTGYPDRMRSTERWKISVRGLVVRPVELLLQDLAREAEPMGVHLLECAGNSGEGKYGLMSAARWTGLPLGRVLQKVRRLPQATRVLISGFDEHSEPHPDSTRGASWIFTFEQLQVSRAFLATEMNGALLPSDHGFPVRLVVPGWYGCTCIKWVNEIVFLDDTAVATDHMREFAGRTDQDAAGPLDFLMAKPARDPLEFGPRLAKDFKPATIPMAALPVRVEKWRVEGKTRYRVVGILWGGDRLTRALVIRLGPDGEYVPVEDFEHRTNATWTLWSHAFQPRAPGKHSIELRVNDPTVRAPRLDSGFYRRSVVIESI